MTNSGCRNKGDGFIRANKARPRLLPGCCPPKYLKRTDSTCLPPGRPSRLRREGDTEADILHDDNEVQRSAVS